MSNVTNGAVSVGTTPVVLIPAANRGTVALPRRVKLYANYAAGGNVVNIGGDAVTASDGFVLEGTATEDFELMPGEELWAVASGGTLEVRFIELGT